ncbi:hypothetical protein CEUSTIGMA_g11424.t1 [Chlamydomonas eustigma]|uniref:Uncharacterized protein n=1 Tax=Chlamydomonas eustigma TaxID=1157962 RepID=A0A250XM46_9CHLO|nr:hypothetical protein CEUSTIGMA_g11424.t1 [Chlamydomonas eustigma]|eukprot:GAX83999.1 hypothetical protein CEUSTIGMA_g11424.t1 [Chlamydomonas eustigma]
MSTSSIDPKHCPASSSQVDHVAEDRNVSNINKISESTASTSASARPHTLRPRRKPTPRWLKIVTVVTKIIFAYEIFHYLSDRAIARRRAFRLGENRWTENEDGSMHSTEEDVVDLLIDYVNGDVDVSTFSQVPQHQLLEAIDDVDSDALEAMGVERGDDAAKKEALETLQQLKEVLLKNRGQSQ